MRTVDPPCNETWRAAAVSGDLPRGRGWATIGHDRILPRHVRLLSRSRNGPSKGIDFAPFFFRPTHPANESPRKLRLETAAPQPGSKNALRRGRCSDRRL